MGMFLTALFSLSSKLLKNFLNTGDGSVEMFDNIQFAKADDPKAELFQIGVFLFVFQFLNHR